MVRQPYHASGGMSEEAYERRTTGKGPTFWDLQRRRVECSECRVELAMGSLLMHRQSKQGVGRGDQGRAPPPPPSPGEAQTYRVSFPKRLSRLRCPVERCLGGVLSRTNLWIYFLHRHVQDTIVILEEGTQPYPRCTQCDIFVPQKALNGRNLVT